MLCEMRLLSETFIGIIVLLFTIYIIDISGIKTLLHSSSVTHKAFQRNINQTSPSHFLETTTKHTSTSISSLKTRSHFYTRARKVLPECASPIKGRAKSFLMVFMSRSGSTAISQTLASHSNIDHRFEFLDSSNVSRENSILAIKKTRKFFNESISNGKIPGFKIRPYHIMSNRQAWKQLVHDFNTRIIWQYRKNIFKTALGIYIREVYNDETATGGIKTEELLKKNNNRCEMGIGCSFNITKLDVFHRILTRRVRQDIEMVRAIKQIDDNRNCVFEMPYEDYLYYKEESMIDLFKFLGLKIHSFETYRSKATSDNLCEVVENFHQLCHYFYGCPIWRPFLEDFENDCRCTKFTYGGDEFCQVYGRKQWEEERQLGDYNQFDSSDVDGEEAIVKDGINI